MVIYLCLFVTEQLRDWMGQKLLSTFLKLIYFLLIGQLSVEDITTMVLCKPKLLPLKSLTLEKLEKMQQAAQDTIRQQEMAEKEDQQIAH